MSSVKKSKFHKLRYETNHLKKLRIKNLEMLRKIKKIKNKK